LLPSKIVFSAGFGVVTLLRCLFGLL